MQVRIRAWPAAAALLMAGAGASVADTLHTPKKGAAEYRAILKSLPGSPAHRFTVHWIKAHNGWAWVDVTPLDERGKPVAEGGPQLLKAKSGAWIVQDLARVPDDPDDPLGAQDASKGFVRNLRKLYPTVPADIFPRPSH